MSGLDKDVGSVEARVEALEKRMDAFEKKQDEMLKVLYMGRGIIWLGGVVAAAAAFIYTVQSIVNAVLHKGG